VIPPAFLFAAAARAGNTRDGARRFASGKMLL
jgi:hypothetical protein